MGIAIILDGCDFSSNNLGVVHELQDVPLVSLGINTLSSIIGTEGKATAIFTPANTNQRSVSWSITAGSEMADIDNYGNISLKRGANGDVTIKVVSVDNPSISATKTISVKYQKDVTETPFVLTKDTVINATDGLYKNRPGSYSTSYDTLLSVNGSFSIRLDKGRQYNLSYFNSKSIEGFDHAESTDRWLSTDDGMINNLSFVGFVGINIIYDGSEVPTATLIE